MRADPAHKAADRTLKDLDRRIAATYGAALKDVQDRMNKFMATFEREDSKYRKRVEHGSATEAQYQKWRRDQIMDSDRFKALTKSLSKDLARHAEIAMALVNGELPDIYAEAMNYGTFEVEHGTTIETAFTLYDRSTVMSLLRDQPDLYPTAAVNKAKQQRWDRQHIVSAVTHGLLAGDPMDRIADRMERVVGMDASVAARAARTCVTAAENSGRVDSYRRAEKLGIRVRKQWLATLDGRTRSSHRALDGESVEIEEEFSNGLKYPGDPSGPGRERYNCRCTLVADLKDFPAEQVNRASKLGDMSYEEWKAEHVERTIPTAPAAPATVVVNGSNVIGQWTRRRSEYQFEIEDVLDYQGFDGNPRIVGADDFDLAVKESGVVMQRSYTGPTKEVADAYRDQLYSGKWYVDCSAGGSQYGQGMYAAADWEGKITDGMRQEMRHYSDLGKQRLSTWHQPTDEERERYALSLLDVDPSMHSAAETYVRFQVSNVGDWDEVSEAASKLGSSLRHEIDRQVVEEARRMVVYDEPVVSYVETMTLDPNARIIKYRDLLNFMNEEPMPSTPGEWSIPGDPGAFAAAKGYDAIDAEGHGASGSYVVVLNRTKLIIKRPEEH